MIFNSKRRSRYQDLYFSNKINEKWSKPKPLSILNSRYNEETPFLSYDESTLIFASDRNGSFEIQKNKWGQIKVSYDLYWSIRKNGKWQKPVKIPGAINTTLHERSPSLSKDNKTLYYITWPFGNSSRPKIMQSKFKNGKFQKPIELKIPQDKLNANLTNKEKHKKYKILSLKPSYFRHGFYFSSLRPDSFGGWDVYFIEYKNNHFGKLSHLDAPINSTYNDFYLTEIKNGYYFTTNRKGGFGKYDIYGLSKPKRKEIHFKILDKKSKKPLSTKVKISASTAKNLNQKIASITKRSNTDGKFLLSYHPLIKKLTLNIQKKGYLPFYKNLMVEDIIDDPFIIQLMPIEKNGNFQIHAIHFEANSYDIKKESYKILNLLFNYLMRKENNFKFKIIGHTDLHGKKKYNIKLSEKRAEAVKQYFVKKGIPENRILTEGAGFSRPLKNIISPEADILNRRTEFKILKVK